MEQSITQRLPTTHLVDPERARREIRIAHWILPLLKLRDRRMARKQRLAAAKSGMPVRA